jgi:hypothetical protein
MTQTINTMPAADTQHTYVSLYVDRLNPKNRHHRALIRLLYLMLHGKSPKAVVAGIRERET